MNKKKQKAIAKAILGLACMGILVWYLFSSELFRIIFKGMLDIL